MASLASPHVEQPALNKPSFAKVASSSYKPHNTKEINTATTDPQLAQPSPTAQAATSAPRDELDTSAQTENHGERRKTILARPEDFELHSEQWSTGGNSITTASIVHRRGDSTQPPKPVGYRQPASDDVATRLSSSGESAKPPSLDGKSVASGTTFALDEKESLRPDDSASLRAVEEDGTSPPGSTAADSRMGSDVGAARAFSEQLREIGTLGPVALRGAPPGRMPPVILPGSVGSVQFGNSRPVSAAAPSVPAHMTLGNGLPADFVETGPLPDEKLLDALESQRDRVWVLKLEQDLIDFVKDPKESQLSLPSCNAFYRMLAHKLADYYILAHTVDESMTGVRVSKTEYCRIPPPLSSFSPNNGVVNTPPIDAPARKIMRRGDEGKATAGTNTTANSDAPSNAASEIGAESDVGSDVKDRQPTSHELRMAKYNEARQRIFGPAVDAAELMEGAKAEDTDISRSSSTSGKKTKKKSRNYDDEDFESRAHFSAYPPQVYASAGYQADNGNMFYNQYTANGMPQQYPAVPQHMPQSMPYGNGYHPQELPQQYGWGQGHMYQQGPPMNYGMAQPIGYDLSVDFQRGMQSFQSASNITPQMPKASPVITGGYQPQYQQPQQQSVGQNWSPMQQQGSFPSAQNQYPPQGSPSMNQAMFQSNYAYGQLPAPTLANGKQNKNQHPLPGSYNRNQFNPQSQAFVPGGRAASFQMQPQLSQMTPPAMHSYPSQSYAMPTQGQMPRPSPPQTQQSSTFASPHLIQTVPSMVKGNIGNRPNMLPQPPPSSSNQAPSIPVGQNHTAQSSNQSSIAKWGTPSHLPPKPPPPASIPPPKFSLPGQNHPAAARLPAPAPVITGRPH